MRYIIRDEEAKTDLFSAELPEGFSVSGSIRNVMKGINRDFEISSVASKEGLSIGVMPGWSCMYEKIRVPSVFGMAPRGETNDAGAYYSDPTGVTYDLDIAAANILGERAGASDYYEVGKSVIEKARQELSESVQRLCRELELGASLSPFPIGNLIRGYLLDGALGVYPVQSGILAVCLCRFGTEADIVQNMTGITEMLWDGPFGSAPAPAGVVTSSAVWTVPRIFYMKGREDDLPVFARFIETFELSGDVKALSQRLWDQNVSSQLAQARANTAMNQQMINAMWEQQSRGWAASDALRDSIHRDLESFHQGLTQSMAQNDARFFTNTSGESSDDRIQRWRHESMMGVETYERGDGTDVEFDSRADRVFENDLDSTSHFGTKDYYDDRVPDGWHELKKK